MAINKVQHLLLLTIAFSAIASSSQSQAQEEPEYGEKPYRKKTTSSPSPSPSSKTTSSPSPSPSSKLKIVCYFENLQQLHPDYGSFLPANIDPNLCTHIIYAFGWLKEGRLSSGPEIDETKAGGLYDAINNLKKGYSDLKILLALGGASYGVKRARDIIDMVQSRQTISSVIPFLRSKGFDGIDIFWKSREEADRKNYVLLLKDLKDAFEVEANNTGKPRLLLTAAVTEGEGYNVQEVSRYVDLISVIAYDLHGYRENRTEHHAPLMPKTHAKDTGAVDSIVKMWENLGVPKDKLVVGMATYGRTYTLSDGNNFGVNAPANGAGEAGEYTREAGILAYYEVCKMLRSGGRYYWDDKMKMPYAVRGKQWVSFDDERSIRYKMKWIIKNYYAGAMVWSLNMDDFRGDLCCAKYPLLGVIWEELREIKRCPQDVDWSKVTVNATREYTSKYDL